MMSRLIGSITIILLLVCAPSSLDAQGGENTPEVSVQEYILLADNAGKIATPCPNGAITEGIGDLRAFPDGWREYACSNPNRLSDADGYFGIAFINDMTQQVMIAHRGTEADVSSWNTPPTWLNFFSPAAASLWAVLKWWDGWMGSDFDDDLILALNLPESFISGNIPPQFGRAKDFTERVQDQLILDQNSHYVIHHTGFSLGGWLAQSVAAWSTCSCNIPTQAVTFDNPGAARHIQRHLCPDINGLDLTAYVNLPNIVNSATPHAGRVFSIDPSWQDARRYNLYASADHVLNALQPYIKNLPLPYYLAAVSSLYISEFMPDHPQAIFGLGLRFIYYTLTTHNLRWINGYLWSVDSFPEVSQYYPNSIGNSLQYFIFGMLIQDQWREHYNPASSVAACSPSSPLIRAHQMAQDAQSPQDEVAYSPVPAQNPALLVNLYDVISPESYSELAVIDTETGEVDHLGNWGIDLQGKLSLSPDGNTLLHTRNGLVHLVDVATGRVSEFNVGNIDHWAMDWAWSSDGQNLAIIGENNLFIWQRTVDELQTLVSNAPVEAVAWSQDGRLAYGVNGSIYIWDMANNTHAPLPLTIVGHVKLGDWMGDELLLIHYTPDYIEMSCFVPPDSVVIYQFNPSTLSLVPFFHLQQGADLDIESLSPTQEYMIVTEYGPCEGFMNYLVNRQGQIMDWDQYQFPDGIWSLDGNSYIFYSPYFLYIPDEPSFTIDLIAIQPNSPQNSHRILYTTSLGGGVIPLGWVAGRAGSGVQMPVSPTNAIAPTPTIPVGCDNGLPPRLTLGGRARVVYDPPYNNALLAAPRSDAARLPALTPGTEFTILEGVVCHNQKNYWHVSVGDGRQGWTAEGENGVYWLEPLP